MGKVVQLYRRNEEQNVELEKALRARQEYFDSLSGERRRKTLEFQKEIDEKLKNAGSQHNRLVLINQMMLWNLAELGKECRKLTLTTS